MDIVCARVDESSSFVEEHGWMILCERAAWRLQVGRLLAARVKELETLRKRDFASSCSLYVRVQGKLGIREVLTFVEHVQRGGGHLLRPKRVAL